MERARLKLALDRLEAEHWSRFEQFASEFLVSDYPNLRTVASTSGDQGRDAELFSPDGLPSVVLQYSVESIHNSRRTGYPLALSKPESQRYHRGGKPCSPKTVCVSIPP